MSPVAHFLFNNEYLIMRGMAFDVEIIGSPNFLLLYMYEERVIAFSYVLWR
jgi:hypothetical protein